MSELTEVPDILIEPLTQDSESESEKELPDVETDVQLEDVCESVPEPPPLRRDKRGRLITDKKLGAIKKAQDKASKKRQEIKEKAKLYEEIKHAGNIDYDKLANIITDKLNAKHEPAKSNSHEPEQPLHNSYKNRPIPENILF